MVVARRQEWVVLALTAALTAGSTLSAEASDEGRVAAALVSQSNYRHYLDDMLYTHEGDARGLFGPEHDLARDNIEAILSSFDLTVTLEPFFFDYDGDEIDETYYNVVGTKLGSTYPDQEYIIGAHYDSYWWDNPDLGNPGADDNASGVALVLEAARVLSPYDSDYTIRFVAFDAEERGLRGARTYVQDHIDDDILGMFSADMVAYDPEDRNTVDISGQQWEETEAFKAALAEAVDAYGQGLIPYVGGALHGSDYLAFEEVGFVACMMIEGWGPNPNYHELEDNVDELNYIDYAYATRVTRSAVGFLVDHAGVDVPIPDADYDGDGDVDLDDYDVFAYCFAGEDTPPPEPYCLFFDFESDGDVDCIDWAVFAAVWTGPGELPLFWSCDDCVVSTAPEPERLALEFTPISRKVRYLSFEAEDVGQTSYVRVTFVDLPSPYNTWNGVQMFVSVPELYCENAGVAQSATCPSQVGGLAMTDFLASTLQCDPPAPLNWNAMGVIHVFHEGIIPGGVYYVQVINSACDLGLEEAFSDPLVVTMAGWADAVKDCSTTPCGPPDDSTGIVDVTAILDKYKNLPGNVIKARADIEGSPAGDARLPDQAINITDVTFCLGAYLGVTYPPAGFPPPSDPPCP